MSEISDAPYEPRSEALLPDEAAIAETLFIQAAGRYQNSGTSQAAFIAGECMANDYDADRLGKNLLANPDKIENIVRIANIAHEAAINKKRAKKGDTIMRRLTSWLTEKPYPDPISFETGRNTIEDIFSFAYQMRNLDRSELEKILIQFPEVKQDKRVNENHEKIRELELRDQAEEMIALHENI